MPAAVHSGLHAIEYLTSPSTRIVALCDTDTVCAAHRGSKPPAETGTLLPILANIPPAMHHFTDVQLRRVVRTVLERAGSEAAEAAQVADHLVDANLRGHDSHGVGMIPHYVHNITNGTASPNTGLSVVRDGGAVMVFDGGMGFGQRVGAQMMERLIGRARELGAVVAALRNVHHLGRIGAYAEMAVAAGLVSIHFVNVTGHPPLVAPYRGSHARFGTNPIAIGVPGTARHEPFLLDMATSLIALGKVRVARNKGEQIAPGTLVDARGQPTTDPNVMFPDDEALRGALLPLGLHKGYGLLFAAELLAGVVGGGETSHPGTAGLDTIRNNMLSVVIDPASLAEPEWIEHELDTIIGLRGFLAAGRPRRTGPGGRRPRANDHEAATGGGHPGRSGHLGRHPRSG